MGGQFTHEQILYSVPVEGTKQKGFSSIYRNPLTPNKLISTPDPKLTSIKDVIYASAEKYKNKDFFGKITIKTVEKEGKPTE